MSETSADYVRRTYDVPAKRGQQVLFQGQPAVITGFSGPYVKIRPEGQDRSVRAHPTWRMDYLDGRGERG